MRRVWRHDRWVSGGGWQDLAIDRATDSAERATEVVDASRRTRLASERTELAWWRTGHTALAVALAVSRVVPELSDSSSRWPYVVAGVCFALYGVAVIAYGSLSRRGLERHLAAGRFPQALGRGHAALVVSGIALGLLTVVLILLD